MPFNDYEVIIGLDGCTDGTEKIIKSFTKKSKKFSYQKLNLRKGKPAVINKIIKQAKGEVIIIHDADWIFRYGNKENISRLIKVFDDKKVGGIAESFPMEWNKEVLKRGNPGYLMVAYSTYFWMNYQKQKFSIKSGEFRIIKEPKMFMTNIFRRELYKPNSLLSDDFERTHDIINRGFKILISEDETFPRLEASYDKLRIRDLFKQKVRTAKAREQLGEVGESIGIKYYLGSIFYILTRSITKGPYIFGLMLYWVCLTIFATFYSKLKKFNTTEGWKMRMKR
jgi:glycosyltransferase involved in cell wall biosynthesis